MNKKEVTALALIALTANAVTVLHANLRTRKPKKPTTTKTPQKDFDGWALRAASAKVGRKNENGCYSTPEQMLEDFEFELIVHNLK